MTKLLDHFTNIKVLESTENVYRPLHIFRELIKHYNHQLTLTDKTLLFLHFEKYESCLQLSRKRELSTATFLMSEMRKLSFDFPSPLKHGMNSLYFAMVAYYEYAFQRYDSALENLDIAIQDAIVQGKKFPLMLCSIGEQWLNKVRVYLKMKNIPVIIKETTKLFSFCLTGTHTDREVETLYKTLGYDNHKLMIDHVINSVCEGIMRMYTDILIYSEALYSDILFALEPILNNQTLNEHAATIIKLIITYYKGDDTTFFKAIANHFEALQNSPRFLQKLVLIYYIKVAERRNESLATHSYFENFKIVCGQLKVQITYPEPVL